MENLQSIMQSLDDISNLIPEGTYLEMCDNLKRVHDQIPRAKDPPITDNRRVPFQVVQGGQVEVLRILNEDSDGDDDDYNPEWYDEWAQNEETIRKLLADRKVVDRSLRILKPILRITKKVREDAIKRFWNFQLLSGEARGELNQWTFDTYIQAIDWNNYSEYARGWFTSKKFERGIYTDYKLVENQRINVRINEVMELKNSLDNDICVYRDRQNYLRVTYNL
tara:strand:+ start:1473 stop:2141 length:669 start_codon:yes stop_codon:yes gene_type:complete